MKLAVSVALGVAGGLLLASAVRAISVRALGFLFPRISGRYYLAQALIAKGIPRRALDWPLIRAAVRHAWMMAEWDNRPRLESFTQTLDMFAYAIWQERLGYPNEGMAETNRTFMDGIRRNAP